jgi:hypothetical protein
MLSVIEIQSLLEGDPMKNRLSLLALIACLGISLTSYASDISYSITSGTFSPSGTFSGSFLIDSISELIDGGSITATAPGGGTTYSFFNSANDSSIPGLAFFADASGDTFRLAINGGLSTLALNTLASNGMSGDTFLMTAAGARFDATGGTIAVAATPEPSSIFLLGTGALGLAGTFRRRFLNT